MGFNETMCWAQRTTLKRRKSDLVYGLAGSCKTWRHNMQGADLSPRVPPPTHLPRLRRPACVRSLSQLLHNCQASALNTVQTASRPGIRQFQRLVLSHRQDPCPRLSRQHGCTPWHRAIHAIVQSMQSCNRAINECPVPYAGVPPSHPRDALAARALAIVTSRRGVAAGQRKQLAHRLRRCSYQPPAGWPSLRSASLRELWSGVTVRSVQATLRSGPLHPLI
jgi:hypothetical protein